MTDPIPEEPSSMMDMGNGKIEDGYIYIESVKTKSSNAPKMILHPMKLDFPENAVTAILGPSGSGKTTLLSVVTDSIQSNVVARAERFMPGASAIVPQDDRLHGFFTCKSYMQHYARLTGINRLPDTDARIDELLQMLGLFDHKDTIVGDLFFKGLSGGQQRRLSIALEALTHPLNFFLDEPTSGLDAESALQVMEFLKNYARTGKGRRVILTIHQPSSFIWQTVDHVILLSKGKLMYNGLRKNMEDFFVSAGHGTPAGWNPADHYITVVNDEFRDHELSVDEWAERFASFTMPSLAIQGDEGDKSKKHRSSSMLRARKAGPIATQRSGSIRAVWELTYRYFLNLAFNPGILGTRIAMYSMLGLMVGALFWNLGHQYDFESVQSRVAVLFYCVSFFIFMSVAVLPFTLMERAIVDKEVLNGYYHPSMYQVSQAIASIPATAFLAFLVTLIIITMTKMRDPLWYFLDMFLSLVVAEALALMVSHVVPHFVIGMALIAGMYGFFMLFQGFMIIPSAFPDWLSWLYYVAFHTYAWRTFMVSQFRGPDEVYTGSPTFTTGEDVLVFYEIEDVNRGHDMIVLVGYALIVHLCSLVILHFRYTLFRGTIEPPTGQLPDKTDPSASADKPDP